jgi:hypothetical protein
MKNLFFDYTDMRNVTQFYIAFLIIGTQIMHYYIHTLEKQRPNIYFI